MDSHPHLFQKIYASALFLAVVAFSLTSCNLPTRSQPTPTSVPPTLTATLPQSTSTAPPTNTPTLTAVPSTATPESTAVRIRFAAGATADIEQGRLQAGESQDFVLYADQSQPMIVSVDSPNNDVTLAIYGQGSGSTLLEASKKWTTWESILPSTQDYRIRVLSGAAAENFTLTVIIPSRITFAQGAASAALSGSTPGGLIVTYVIYALANQQLTVALNVPTDSAAVSIYGFEDGVPLLRSNSHLTNWSGNLPVTEDYIIQIVPFSGQVVNYSLTVSAH